MVLPTHHHQVHWSQDDLWGAGRFLVGLVVGVLVCVIVLAVLAFA